MADSRIPSPLRLRKVGRALTAEQVRSLVHYDPEAGTFTWLPRAEVDGNMRTWNTKWAGKRTGITLNDMGYPTIGIFDQRYLAHRIAWLYMTGHWPAQCIDHINMDRTDYRFANLREATNAENHYNRVIQSNNKAGHLGVYLHKRSGMWHALITHDGRKISLGYFHSPELASVAYRTAERLIRGKWVARDRERGNAPLAIEFDD